MKEKDFSRRASAERGQALITLLVAIAVALSILTAATLASISLGKDVSRNVLGRKVYYAAETGAEYGLMKLMRNPTTCSGTDNLTLDSADITITYTDLGANCGVSSKAQIQNLVKTVQVETSYDSNQIFNYYNWIETP
jgi:hypothetical protein